MKLKSILVISTTFQLRNKMQPCKEKSYIKPLNPLKEKKNKTHYIYVNYSIITAHRMRNLEAEMLCYLFPYFWKRQWSWVY